MCKYLCLLEKIFQAPFAFVVHICIYSSILLIQYFLNLLFFQLLHFFQPGLFTLCNFIIISVTSSLLIFFVLVANFITISFLLIRLVGGTSNSFKLLLVIFLLRRLPTLLVQLLFLLRRVRKVLRGGSLLRGFRHGFEAFLSLSLGVSGVSGHWRQEN
uniref:Uncharacterized protein n=1 Tax=Opuntia streptacantha TaxID=393608 RepID=A0A7C8YMQ6_OPUST